MISGVPILVGPTGSGKTQLSLLIAERMPCEIVSADSRQIYRHMDIGTAKPSPAVRRRFRHHCIDLFEPDEVFSAGRFGPLARGIVDDIFSRGLTPLVVGGSGLYIRALVDGIFEGSFRDEGLRRSLNEEAEKRGLDALYRRLSSLDPDAARKIHANDRKRIIRALEVRLLSGIPLSTLQREGTVKAGWTPLFFGLNWPRDILVRRIGERVDAMLRDGLVREVRELALKGYSLRHNAMDSVGYKEILMHLDGTLGLDAAVELIKQNTRRFAKRQMTWFRGEPRIRWFDVRETGDLASVGDRIAADIESGTRSAS
jgi:tRNA dimethylallyltransferase